MNNWNLGNRIQHEEYEHDYIHFILKLDLSSVEAALCLNAKVAQTKQRSLCSHSTISDMVLACVCPSETSSDHHSCYSLQRLSRSSLVSLYFHVYISM